MKKNVERINAVTKWQNIETKHLRNNNYNVGQEDFESGACLKWMKLETGSLQWVLGDGSRGCCRMDPRKDGQNKSQERGPARRGLSLPQVPHFWKLGCQIILDFIQRTHTALWSHANRNQRFLIPQLRSHIIPEGRLRCSERSQMVGSRGVQCVWLSLG